MLVVFVIHWLFRAENMTFEQSSNHTSTTLVAYKTTSEVYIVQPDYSFKSVQRPYKDGPAKKFLKANKAGWVPAGRWAHQCYPKRRRRSQRQSLASEARFPNYGIPRSA